jgi:hypothetical protein
MMSFFKTHLDYSMLLISFYVVKFFEVSWTITANVSLWKKKSTSENPIFEIVHPKPSTRFDEVQFDLSEAKAGWGKKA